LRNDRHETGVVLSLRRGARREARRHFLGRMVETIKASERKETT
jgi:hypothetical protein